MKRWLRTDPGIFSPTGEVTDEIPPGIYQLASGNGGPFFVPVPVRQDELMRFEDSVITEVVAEITRFWQQEERFLEHDLVYKRGILLYGPPGSGKSCTVRLIAEDVVARDGLVLLFSGPQLLVAGFRHLRERQPDVPVVVVMEDLDQLLQTYNESATLNVLDGIEMFDRVVFLATTNYPEQMSPRVVNRPSRFDRRYRIGLPNPATRRAYLELLRGPGDEFDVEAWVRDTHQLSLAHLKELFVSTVIMGGDYDTNRRLLASMGERITAADTDDDGAPLWGYA